MRFVRLVLLAATLLLAACTGSTPTALPPTASAVPSAAPLTPVPTLAPPTETAIPPTETASPAPSATTGGPTPTTGPTPTATLDPAVAVIYAYLVARAKADVEGVMALACDAFDGQAATEAVSFRSMNAVLNDDLQCGVDGADGPYTLVACTGTMTTTYGPESRDWDLSNAIYRATLEDGAWTMCGYH